MHQGINISQLDGAVHKSLYQSMGSLHIFLHELENGFELSLKEARGILDSAKTIFNLEGASYRGNIRPGQIRDTVLAKDASVGKPLSQLKKVEVTLPQTLAKKTSMFFQNMLVN